MADRQEWPGEWNGHRLTPLPQGERWLLSDVRETVPAQPADARPPVDVDPWIFDLTDGDVTTDRTVDAPATVKVAPTAAAVRSHRGIAVLLLLGISALITIFAARSGGKPHEPEALPEPPSSVITAVNRTTPQEITVHVGDYVRFQLPGSQTYSAVIEQPGAATPVLEALNLPGQQPLMRADSRGHAFIEVMQEPACADPNGCPDRRTLVGGVSVTVAP